MSRSRHTKHKHRPREGGKHTCAAGRDCSVCVGNRNIQDRRWRPLPPIDVEVLEVIVLTDEECAETDYLLREPNGSKLLAAIKQMNER